MLLIFCSWELMSAKLIGLISMIALALILEGVRVAYEDALSKKQQ